MCPIDSCFSLEISVGFFNCHSHQRSLIPPPQTAIAFSQDSLTENAHESFPHCRAQEELLPLQNPPPTAHSYRNPPCLQPPLTPPDRAAGSEVSHPASYSEQVCCQLSHDSALRSPKNIWERRPHHLSGCLFCPCSANTISRNLPIFKAALSHQQNDDFKMFYRLPHPLSVGDPRLRYKPEVEHLEWELGTLSLLFTSS